MEENRKSLMSMVGIAVVILGIIVVQVPVSQTASGATTAQKIQQLPISDFLNLLPSQAATVYTDPTTGNRLVIDSYGKRNVFFNLNLDTTVTGVLTVKDQGTPTARHTKNKNKIWFHFRNRKFIN